MQFAHHGLQVAALRLCRKMPSSSWLSDTDNLSMSRPWSTASTASIETASAVITYKKASFFEQRSEMNIANCRLMGLALRPQLPPLDAKSVTITI